MMPNQTSTRFSHDPEVGVNWVVIRGLAARPITLRNGNPSSCLGAIGLASRRLAHQEELCRPGRVINFLPIQANS